MSRIALFVILLSQFGSFAQSKVDSLELSFENEVSLVPKINILHQLFSEYRLEDRVKAEEKVVASIQLSKEAGNQELLAKSYNQYGEFLQSLSRYDSAMTLHRKALSISEEHQIDKELSTALMQIGLCYQRTKKFDKAIEFLERNLSLCRKLKDESCIGNTYSVLGLTYMSKNEFAKSMQYFTDAREIHARLGNQKELGMTLANMGMNFAVINNREKGNSYLLQADSVLKIVNYKPGIAFVKTRFAAAAMADGDFEKSERLYLDALKDYEELGNLDRMGRVYYTLGVSVWHRNQFKKALYYYQKKLGISETLQDSIGMSTVLKAIGTTHEMLGDNAAAIENYNKALVIAKKSKYGPNLMDAYKALADIYKKQGNFAKAYEHERIYGLVKDSLYTKERRDYANEIEAKYESEQKAKENALLAKDNALKALKLEEKTNERNVIIAFAVLALLLALLLYNQFRIKQKANIKLQELDRLKSNFFTNISHEFRTPLTLIKGPIEHLEQNPEERLSVENVKMIRRNSNRLLKLVNQLLDLSKSDEGSLQLEPTEGDIFKCLRGVTSSFNSHAAQRQIDYRVSIPQSVLWTSFDRDKIEKVLYNLLSNAFKFSEDTTVINCSVHHDTGTLFIEVSDSGKGIPKEQLPLIFDRFYQVDSTYTRTGEGSGIGLSIAKEFVNLMDGTITVSSELNKGTYFTVQLPLQEIKTGKSKVKTGLELSAEPLQKKPYTLTKEDKRDLPSILLIEDNKDMRHFIREQLIQFYRFREAANGELGLSEAIANPPDLIITDLMMPKMDGIEVCKNLKSHIATSHIPVIMLTAKAGMENKIEGLETGADDYLTKPFNAEELLARTNNLIVQRQKLRALFTNKEQRIDPKAVTVTSLDQKFLEDVLNLLEVKFSEAEFGVPQMQDALAMSKTQLHRKLKALTNEAPGELLRNFRLKRAAQLLLQEADNVTQIAYAVGFNNLSYFAKCFKELYGVSPSSYSQSLPK